MEAMWCVGSLSVFLKTVKHLLNHYAEILSGALLQHAHGIVRARWPRTNQLLRSSSP